MFSDKCLLLNRARVVKVRNGSISESKIQKYFEEIRAIKEGGRILMMLHSVLFVIGCVECMVCCLL
jgi:hypothetical protein